MVEITGFIAAEDSTPGTHPVVVLSDALWRRRYSADPAIVGRTVQVDKRTLTVVGIAPASFRGLSGTIDLWVPLAMAPVLSYPEVLQERWAHWLDVVARLKPGVEPVQAAAAPHSSGDG